MNESGRHDERTEHTSMHGPTEDDLASAQQAQERRIRQIQELVQLSHSLRADLGLHEILRRLASAVSSAIGFGIAAFNLVHPGQDQMEVAAVAGAAVAQYQPLLDAPPRLSAVREALQERFRLGRSYFIPHEHGHVLDGVETITVGPLPPEGVAWPRDAWHPNDVLLVPLVSRRDQRLLGILSLDAPGDGHVPTQETIEVVELFANLAAVAIEMASLFDERERDRQALEAGLARLQGYMEHVGRGNLAERADLGETALSPIGDSLNAMVGRLSGVVVDVRHAGEVVSASALEAQTATRDLADKGQRQARRIVEVSAAVAGVADDVRRIADTASTAEQVARGASEIAHEGRAAAERAAIGMTSVREMTLRAARSIKRLGEKTQQIGEIVRLVADFAEQTNLLALNAAIEAVRAGEHGTGFNTIAQQIRKLAESSAEATSSIDQRIKAVQVETNAVVKAIEESTREVVTQSDLAAQAGAALGAVDMVNQTITERVGVIRETADQQAMVSQRIARAMDEIADVTAETRDGMQQMESAMERLAELARSLQREIAVFRLRPPDAGAPSGWLEQPNESPRPAVRTVPFGSAAAE